MRRLGRWLLSAVAAISLTISIASVAMWLRSYFVADTIAIPLAAGANQAIIRAAHSIDGFLVLYEFTSPVSKNDTLGLSWIRTTARLMHPPGGHMPFAFTMPHGPSPIRWSLRTSYWFLAAIASVIPILRIRQFSRMNQDRKRLTAGHCAFCGYDLRATPVRCPECGTVVQQKVQT